MNSPMKKKIQEKGKGKMMEMGKGLLTRLSKEQNRIGVVKRSMPPAPTSISPIDRVATIVGTPPKLSPYNKGSTRLETRIATWRNYSP